MKSLREVISELYLERVKFLALPENGMYGGRGLKAWVLENLHIKCLRTIINWLNHIWNILELKILRILLSPL